jgi:hypothetical protein
MQPSLAVDLHDWARANENERQFSLEARVVLRAVEGSRDPAWVAWSRRVRERRPDGSPAYGLDWLNARSPLKFATRRVAVERSLAVAQSQLWRGRGEPEEVLALADAATAHPGFPVALVTHYHDHNRLYCYLLPGQPVPPPRFEFVLDETPATLCRLSSCLEWLVDVHGEGYLHLGETA